MVNAMYINPCDNAVNFELCIGCLIGRKHRGLSLAFQSLATPVGSVPICPRARA